MKVVDKQNQKILGTRIPRRLKKAFKKIVAFGTAYKPEDVKLITIQVNSRYANFKWHSGNVEATIGNLTVTSYKLS